MSTALTPDYERFCGGVKQLCGIDLFQYRPGQMERRLRSFARRSGHGDLDGYLTALKRDVAARSAFLDHMTINVSELFRNPERFLELEQRFIPELLAGARGRGLRVWSAGCSYGAEPYTLAILLKEAGPRLAHELVATDIDETILARAREGYFTDADLQQVTPARRQRWFDRQPDGRMRVKPELRAMVRFGKLDLLKDPYPRTRDLILCRNVVIYFNEDAKERIYDRFFQVLTPGGTLFVGSTERVTDAARLGWERPSTFFYRRPA
ncbi:MAG TPA: protein-glutamate O-methyltransferase CheR [Miltoncostaea sp.]|nr:protein-glutamate O-methyltransferase CheR [Miltoncostaea sp.]